MVLEKVLVMFGCFGCTILALCFIELRRIRKKLEGQSSAAASMERTPVSVHTAART